MSDDLNELTKLDATQIIVWRGKFHTKNLNPIEYVKAKKDGDDYFMGKYRKACTADQREQAEAIYDFYANKIPEIQKRINDARMAQGLAAMNAATANFEAFVKDFAPNLLALEQMKAFPETDIGLVGALKRFVERGAKAVEIAVTKFNLIDPSKLRGVALNVALTQALKQIDPADIRGWKDNFSRHNEMYLNALKPDLPAEVRAGFAGQIRGEEQKASEIFAFWELIDNALDDLVELQQKAAASDTLAATLNFQSYLGQYGEALVALDDRGALPNASPIDQAFAAVLSGAAGLVRSLDRTETAPPKNQPAKNQPVKTIDTGSETGGTVDLEGKSSGTVDPGGKSNEAPPPEGASGGTVDPGGRSNEAAPPEGTPGGSVDPGNEAPPPESGAGGAQPETKPDPTFGGVSGGIGPAAAITQMYVDIDVNSDRGAWLNLRSRPELGEATKKAKLHACQPVTVIGAADAEGWAKVKAMVDGAETEGYVSARLLREPAGTAREQLIQHAIAEWARFDYGRGDEKTSGFSQLIKQMWMALGFKKRDGVTGEAWSAACISNIIRNASAQHPLYKNFKEHGAHSRYVFDAMLGRESETASAPFWAYEVDEKKPELGDMVCASRTTSVTDFRQARKRCNDWNAKQATSRSRAERHFFPSHCDIIVRNGADAVVAIGGNVGDTVKHTVYPKDENGYLIKARSYTTYSGKKRTKHLIALLKNRADD